MRGFAQTAYSHHRPDRVAGEQKFNIVKDTILGLQAVISFSLLPLRLIFFMGFILAGVSFAIMALNLVAIILNIFGLSGLFDLLPKGLKTLNLISLFFQGIVFIALGTIGEYVGRVYEQTKGRATFVVKSIIGDINEK